MPMIDDVEVRIKQLEQQLEAEKSKLITIRDEIPEEFHAMTADVFAKLKAIFEPEA